MTSWHDLPFELKAQILTLHIDNLLPSTPAVEYHHVRRASVREDASSGILSFLLNAPEMQQEAASIVTSMLKQRLGLYTRLENELETVHSLTGWRQDVVQFGKAMDLKWRQLSIQEEIELLEFLKHQSTLDV